MRVPEFRIENGRRIYSVGCTINCEARPATITARAANTAGDSGGAASGDAGSGDPAAQDPGVERYRWRFISAVQAWPNTYWGPQLIDYSHNNAAALREVVGLVNANRPPLMVNHTNDMNAQAGVIENAAWEDSTDISPGVNGDLVVSSAFDERTAAGLRLGFITAGSISVRMEIVQSHPDMEWETFVDVQGKTVDGELVRWLPVGSGGVDHFALVHAGADPNARPRGDTTNQRTDRTAGPHTIQEGESMDDILSVLQKLCRTLGIEAVLTANGPVPDGLEARASEQIRQLMQAAQQFNSLTADLQKLAGFVIQSGETTLSSAEILNRVPARLQLSTHGEAYLEALRTDAVKYYGLARFTAEKREASDLEKRQMARIRQSASVEELRDWIEEYRPSAENRLGANGMRTSQGEELPTGTAGAATRSAAEQDIRQSAARVHGNQVGGAK